MKKPKFSTYNDGVAFICREKRKETSFNAKENATILTDMEFIVKLDYEETSKREQDFDFAEQNSRILSLKIKTRKAQNVDNKCKAVINNYLYDIWCADHSKTETYLYMEGVRPIVT